MKFINIISFLVKNLKISNHMALYVLFFFLTTYSSVMSKTLNHGLHAILQFFFFCFFSFFKFLNLTQITSASQVFSWWYNFQKTNVGGRNTLLSTTFIPRSRLFTALLFPKLLKVNLKRKVNILQSDPTQSLAVNTYFLKPRFPKRNKRY